MKQQTCISSMPQGVKAKGAIFLLASVGGLAYVLTVGAAEIPPQSVTADTFNVGGGRQAGVAVKGLKTEVGALSWKALGNVVLREDGALTVGDGKSAVAWLPLLPEVRQAPFKVQVDCQPATSDWVGLSLGGELGDFFKAAKISLILRPNGSYSVFAGEGASQWATPLAQGKATKFDEKGWNTLGLEFDPIKVQLSATINGADVLRDHALSPEFPASQIQFAGVRFNETTGTRPPMQANAPAVDNFAVVSAQPVAAKPAAAKGEVKPVAKAPEVATAASKELLLPLNRTQFFLQPNTPTTLKWKVQGEVGQGETSKIAFEVRDYNDTLISSPAATIANGEAQLKLQLPAGFYEIKALTGGQRFGIVSLPPYQGTPDRFFAIDAALSWLETRPEMRTDLVALLKRSGIGLVRERISWGAVNPQADQWDWETNRGFDTLRKEYARQGIQLLDIFHGAPDWAKTDKNGTYPDRLQLTKQSWQTIGKHWQGAWNSLEVWNEPDIAFGGEDPADKYLPIVKTLNYGLSESQSPALVGGGVFGYFNPTYIRDSVKNGLLDQVDFVSFHTYAKALSMEGIVTDYRGALTVPGRPVVPLWITEAGQPWKSGQNRPTSAEDANSALDITMKAIESRACGIARHFAFVYPFYIEGTHNFGMMGQEVSPLRSMAAYVQAVAALSGTTYVGDLNLKTPAVQRARVFAKGDNAVVVLYNEKAQANRSVAWTGNLTGVQGIDGRALKRLPNGAIPFADGLTYVRTSLKSLTGLQRQTPAARLTATAKSARLKRPAASAIVLQPVLPPTVLATKSGYKVPENALEKFPFRVRVNNLANTAKPVTLRCTLNGGALPVRQLQLAPQTSEEVQWEVNLNGQLQQSGVESLAFDVTGQEPGSEVRSSLALNLFSERDLPTYLKLYPSSTKLGLTDLAQWKPNITPVGEMKMNVVDGTTWQLLTTYKSGDRWAFPELKLPANLDFKGSQGFIVRARAVAPSTVRLMVKERSGSTYFTPFSFIPADGAWHAVVLKWGELAALPSAPPDPNGQLDLDQITSISLGMNSKTDENTLEVSDLYVARKP